GWRAENETPVFRSPALRRGDNEVRCAATKLDVIEPGPIPPRKATQRRVGVRLEALRDVPLLTLEIALGPLALVLERRFDALPTVGVEVHGLAFAESPDGLALDWGVARAAHRSRRGGAHPRSSGSSRSVRSARTS